MHKGTLAAVSAGAPRPIVGWAGGLVALAGLVAFGFTLAPGDLAATAYLALHGLCAQNPSRTFALGGLPLPVDARMTGLYLGALMAAGPLLLARQRGVVVGRGWLVALVAGVAIMALDGLNSLRVDLWQPAWWPPDNRVRLVTGMLAGAGLGVAVAWLVKLALWPAAAPLLRPRDIVPWSLGAVGGTVIVLGGSGWAFISVTLLLMIGAALTLTGLNLAVLGLALTPDGGTGARGSAPALLALLALTGALLEMAALASGRLALEAALGRWPAM